MELAVQEARPVPTEAIINVTGSKGTGAMAKPAAAVVTTRAMERRVKLKKSIRLSAKTTISENLLQKH